MYSISWKYKIKPDKREKFENEYSISGAWSKLFRNSKDYKGSTLNKSETEPDVYVLTDTWTDEKSYEDFKINYAEVYDKLSRKFEDLYVSEERIVTHNKI